MLIMIKIMFLPAESENHVAYKETFSNPQRMFELFLFFVF